MKRIKNNNALVRNGTRAWSKSRSRSELQGAEHVSRYPRANRVAKHVHRGLLRCWQNVVAAKAHSSLRLAHLQHAHVVAVDDSLAVACCDRADWPSDTAAG